MKKFLSFFKEKIKTSDPIEFIAILFCSIIALALVIAFILGIVSININEKTIAMQISILQTTFAIITFGGAAIAFVGWKTIKETARTIAEATAEEAVKKYFLSNAPGQKPTDDDMKKDDIEEIDIEKSENT